jgi:hypothetical protein
MPTLLAQITPQRSTQYGSLASHLAPYELQLSPLGPYLNNLTAVSIGSQEYIRAEIEQLPRPEQLREFSLLATVSALFEYFDQLADIPGPLLRPVLLPTYAALPLDLPLTRRYRGKTNELFTHFLCNLARYSSTFREQPWSNLRVFDPLAGGGTTLLTALVLGAHVAGIEQNEQDVQTTAAFLRDYLHEAHIACQLKEERFKKLGRRWLFTINKPGQDCILAQGDTVNSAALLPGFKPQLIVTDLPYGIQHSGPLISLLSVAMPVWGKMLSPGGALVFAWDATRFSRHEMIHLVQQLSPLRICNEPPYPALVHRVDRVIKQREILVAVNAA